MFPRVRKSNSNGNTYEYLVISESTYEKGKIPSTRNIANLGNIKNFKTKDIDNLISGLIKIFKSEKYTQTDGIDIIESLEHGGIILWQKIWNELRLTTKIKKLVKLKNSKIELEAEKYIEIMTINRCIEPLSKLGVTRWIESTCYKEMKGYKGLDLEVNNFYRSMDHLLDIKDKLESEIYDTLRNLFSVNVKMTFYDITSTFFYTGSCPISNNGYSRDSRPDKEQIIVGVVTSYEGYPIKHYVFEGNTKDETTVKEVIKDLKEKYNIEETTFVGDRGMITKLNLEKVSKEGYDYIMGVKIRQDEICAMLFTESALKEEECEDYRQLKIKEKKIKVKEFLIWKIKEILKSNAIKAEDNKVNLLEERIGNLRNEDEPKYEEYKSILKEISQEINSNICRKIFGVIKRYKGKYGDELRYVICLNKDRKEQSKKKREGKISEITNELNKVFSGEKREGEMVSIEKSLNKIFEGYKARYKRYFEIYRDKENKKAIGYQINKKEIQYEERLDGIFALLTNRHDLEISKVVESYKNLQEVEILFDDFKNFVDVRPVRHWLEERVRSHVFICMLALLLKRIFEINCLGGKAITKPLEEISKSKLIKYKVTFSEKDDRCKAFLNVTNTNPTQKKYL